MLKILFIALLVLNFLTEALAALSLITGPQGLSQAGSGEMWSMHYGFAALSIASLSVWAFFQRHNASAITVTLGTLLVFHTGVCFSLFAAADQPAGMTIQAVLAVLCALLFFMRGRFTAA